MTPDQAVPPAWQGPRTFTSPPGSPSWVNTCPQVGPIAFGPGTLRGAYAQMKADPNVQAIAAGVDAAHPQDEAFRGLRTGVGAARAGYSYGKAQAQQGQGQPTLAADSGGVWASNGDGGSELATKEDLQGVHDSLQESIGGIQNSAQAGGQQNQNLQQMTPSRMPDRPASVSPLAASAAQRDRAQASMAQAGQQLAATKSNSSARFAARQALGSQVVSSGSGLGSSASMNEATMSGMITPSGVGMPPSGNGSSASSFASKKWR